MTKAQMYERIRQSATISRASVKEAVDIISSTGDDRAVALGAALFTIGSGIADALNNIAIILCETLPKEE